MNIKNEEVPESKLSTIQADATTANTSWVAGAPHPHYKNGKDATFDDDDSEDAQEI